MSHANSHVVDGEPHQTETGDKEQEEERDQQISGYGPAVVEPNSEPNSVFVPRHLREGVSNDDVNDCMDQRRDKEAESVQHVEANQRGLAQDRETI